MASVVVTLTTAKNDKKQINTFVKWIQEGAEYEMDKRAFTGNNIDHKVSNILNQLFQFMSWTWQQNNL